VTGVVIGPAGFYGKIPAQPDFIRLHSGAPAVQALASWMEESLETPRGGSRDQGGAGPRDEGGALRFLLRFEEADGALLGALAQSRDRGGRAFPLAVFTQLSGPDVAADFPILPAAAATFLDAVEAWLADARSLPLAELVERARALPLPEARDLAAARSWAEECASPSPARELMELSSGTAGTAGASCSLHAFRAACDAARGKPARTTIAIDCPVARDVDVYAWLELARRSLSWRAPPSFLWRRGARGQLIVALGTAPAAVVAHLLGPASRHPRIWPLLEHGPGAAAVARRALGPSLLAALGRADLTIGELVAAFSRWERS